MPSELLNSLRFERPTTLLYHYTSSEGLIGIIESKSLWASGIHYLNDTGEYKYATEIVRSILGEHIYLRKFGEEANPLSKVYDLLLRSLPFCAEATVFVGSLSEEKDKLSQWRGYCPNGGGFSIGFDPKVIEMQAKKQGYYLLKCEYDLNKQRALCEELIADGFEGARRAELMTGAAEPLGGESSKESMQTVGLWHGFVEPLMRIAPALKNPSFIEEREWRLVRGPFDEPDPELRFRPGKYAVIPYRQFALAEESSPLEIEEIIVGPNPDPVQARRSVQYLVNARKVNCKRIVEYSGTYRNW